MLHYLKMNKRIISLLLIILLSFVLAVRINILIHF